MRTHSLNELRSTLQALALDWDVQRTLFPSFVVIADELALDFEHWRATALGQHQFTSDQRAALAAVDALLITMTSSKNPKLWTDSALAHDYHWQQVRELARQALQAFGWTIDVPPANRSTYVKGR